MSTQVERHKVESRFEADYFITLAKREGKTLRDLDGFIATTLWAPGLKEYFVQRAKEELAPD